MEETSARTLLFGMWINGIDKGRFRKYFCAFMDEAFLKKKSLLPAQVLKFHKQACQPALEMRLHIGHSDPCMIGSNCFIRVLKVGYALQDHL
jgi:hypothetical protein